MGNKQKSWLAVTGHITHNSRRGHTIATIMVLNIIAFGWGFREWCMHASSRVIVRINSVMIDTCILEQVFVKFQSCSVWWNSLPGAKSTGRLFTMILVWVVTAKEMLQRHNSIPSAISGWQTSTLSIASQNHQLELNPRLAPFQKANQAATHVPIMVKMFLSQL